MQLEATIYQSGNVFLASDVIVARKASLLGILGYNNSAGAIFVMIFDSASIPLDGTGLTGAGLAIAVGPGQSFSIDTSSRGEIFTNGISYCVSTTLPLKTLGPAVLYLRAKYG